MLQGKQLILATKPFAKENRAKSWFYTISTLVLLIAALFGTVYNFHWSLKIASSILAGLVIVRLFVIYHDHQHKAILDKSPLATFIFTLFGFYVLAPTGIWSASHDYHHKNNCKLFSASIGSYPIYTKHKFDNLSAGEKRHYLFIRHPLTILFGYIFTFMYGMCIKSMINRFSKNMDSLVGLILHISYQVTVFYFLGWQTWILMCAIPHFISGAMGSYLFYAQHNFPTVTFVGNEEWTYEGAALDSSSFMKLNPLMHWFTANIGYHHIHHMNSRIPFYRLPEVWDAVPEMRTAKTTSLKIKDIWACLKLKVWDFDNKKMVGV
ncbi:MAG: fatty acid desaturase [Bacteroidetes bacterium]|nr:fatty acid desaturase [Bacteroidota bacterium]